MEENIFARIGRGEVPVEKIYEDEWVIAFADLHPQAPVHALVIPKKPVVNLLGLTDDDRELAGAVLLATGKVATLLGVAESGFRVVFNVHHDGGQSVPHLHAHVLGGRAMTWPPG